jgi:acylphosphatase
MAENTVRIRAVARGRVQMVGYRAFVQRHASDLDVRGTVSNRPDGSVECLMEGSRAAVDRLVDLMRQGPFHARVEAVDVQQEAPTTPLPPVMVAS